MFISAGSCTRARVIAISIIREEKFLVVQVELLVTKQKVSSVRWGGRQFSPICISQTSGTKANGEKGIVSAEEESTTIEEVRVNTCPAYSVTSHDLHLFIRGALMSVREATAP